MASSATQLLSKIMRTGQLAPVLDGGITSDDFPTSTERAMFDRLVSESTKYGGVIGANLAKEIFPMFTLCDDETTTVEQLIAQTRQQRLVRELKAACVQADALAEVDPAQALDYLEEILAKQNMLRAKRRSGLTFERGMQLLAVRYNSMKAGLIVGKANWPWVSMQTETQGMQDDDYIVYYGRPKSKKTFVLTYHIAETYNQGKRVLVYTKEMTDQNMLMRIAAFVGQLPYRETRLAKLDESLESVYLSLPDYVKERREETNGKNDLMILSGADVEEGGDTIEWLHRQIDAYEPDVVFIDGLYLMSPPKGVKKSADLHSRVLEISRSARRVQLRTKCPFAVTMQANRAAAKHAKADFDEIAYSDAIGQDVTAGIRVINEKVSPTIALVFAGSREYQLHGIRIEGEPCLPFTEICQLTEGDIMNAKSIDTVDREEDNKKLLRKDRKDREKQAEADAQRLIQKRLQAAIPE